jgi:hypothetical protein
MLSRGNWDTDSPYFDDTSYGYLFQPFFRIYMVSMGEYGWAMDGFETDPNKYVTTVLFVFCTLVISVVMLNLLIGIIGLSY